MKGTLSGTFYANDGTPTKVKCDLMLGRADVQQATFGWGSCPGISAYGTGVFMNPGQSQRILKNSVPQKSCIIANQGVLGINQMAFVSIGVVTTSDTAEATVLLKEKGTLSFTRNDGIFTGKYTVTYPKP